MSRYTLLLVLLVVSLPALALTTDAVAADIGADYLYYQAEDGAIEPPMVISAADGETGVCVPDGAGNAMPGSVTVAAHVPVAGTYNVWVLLLKPSPNSNPIRIVVGRNGTSDIDPPLITGNWLVDIETVGAWEWLRVPNPVLLDPGTYSVGLGRDSDPVTGIADPATGTLIGQVLVTNDLNYSPLSPLNSSSFKSGVESLAGTSETASAETGPSSTQPDTPWALSGLSPMGHYFRNFDESVSVSSGLMTVHQRDLRAPGRDLDLIIARAYQTPALFKDGTPYDVEISPYANLGPGWSLDLPWVGDQYLHMWRGQQFKIATTKISNTLYRFENYKNGHFVLTKHLDAVKHWFIFTWYTYRLNHWELSTPDGTSYLFDSAGYLQRVSSLNGNQIRFSYAGSPRRLSQIVDTVGRTATFSHASDYLDSVTVSGPDPQNYPVDSTTRPRTVKYGYVGGRLESVTDPIGSTGTTEGHVTRFEYDASNKWLLTAIIYPTGGGSKYTYDDQPVTSQDYPGYAKYRIRSHRRQTNYGAPIATAGDYLRTYSYSMRSGDYWFRIANTWSHMKDEAESATHRHDSFECEDSEDSVVLSHTVLDSANSLTRKTSFAHNVNKELIERQETRYGSSTAVVTMRWEYDRWGNITKSTDALGNTRHTAFSNSDPPTWSSSDFYGNSINALIHDRPIGSYYYQDTGGGVPSIKVEVYLQYDSRGNPTESKWRLDTPAGTKWLKSANLYTTVEGVTFGPTRIIRGPDLTSPIAMDITYDNYRAFPAQLSTLVECVRSTADSADQLYNVVTMSEWSPNLGTLASKTDGNGRTLHFEYDLLRRPTLVKYPERAGEQGWRLAIMTEYHVINGVTSSVAYYGVWNSATNSVDQKWLIRRYSFDGLGRQTKEETFESIPAYNAGQPESVKSTTYNWQGLVAAETLAGSPSEPSYTTSYEYDLFGRISKITNSDGSFRDVRYDDARHWANDASPDGSVKTAIDEAGHKKEYFFDWTDQLVQIKEYRRPDDPTPVSTSYVYDAAGNLIAVTDGRMKTTRYGYDTLNRLAKTSYPINAGKSTSTSISYDGFGRIEKKTDQKGSVTVFQYDQLDRLLSRESRDFNGIPRLSATFRYDPVGNLVYATESDGSTATSTTKRWYDELDRMVEEATITGGKTFKTSYGFDINGLLGSIAAPGGKVIGYDYDDLGRVTALRRGTDTASPIITSYQYYSLGPVKDVLFGNGVTTQYNLDSTRPRINRISTHHIDPVSGQTRSLLDLAYQFFSNNDIKAISSDSFLYDGLGRVVESFVY